MPQKVIYVSTRVMESGRTIQSGCECYNVVIIHGLSELLVRLGVTIWASIEVTENNSVVMENCSGH